MIVSCGYKKNGFDAYGGKVLKKSDMSYWMKSPLRTDPDGVALELGEEVEEVEADFFDTLPTIDELWILNPDCNINMTENTLRLFQKNGVLLRGGYDTAAERLAREYRLKFLHLDAELAREGTFDKYGVDIITLRFRHDGSAYINQDCKCPGSNAGNIGGGEVDFDLPNDFYIRMDADELARKCWQSNAIIKNGVLAAFMEKAKEKNGYYLDFGKKQR
ncbi:MAG: hypothetical protein J5879_07350 [Clostridia bacterium]|nr:hypothetical protein [Clostridia bacterium]